METIQSALVATLFSRLIEVQSEIGLRFGGAARLAFLWPGIVVLFSTELALLDAVSRISFLRGSARFPIGRLYFASLWAFIAFGIAVLAVGLSSPLTLLVLSASLNAGGNVPLLGPADLAELAHDSRAAAAVPVRIAMLSCVCAFRGYFSVLAVSAQLAHLLG